MNNLEESLTPKEILKESLAAAKYFTKSNDLSATFATLGTLGVEDLASEAVLHVLNSSVLPKTKSYVWSTVRCTGIDVLRKGSLGSPGYPEAPEETEDLITVEDIDVSLPLSGALRDLFSLLVYQGLSSEEIALEWNTGLTTVHNTTRKLKETIRESIRSLG